MLADRFKGGYWFTIALFEYYLTYDLIRRVAYPRTRLHDGLLLLTALAGYAVALPTVQRFYADQPVALVFGLAQWKYFLFFVLGVFVRRHSVWVHSERGGAVVIVTFLWVYGGNAVLAPQWSGLLFNANLLLQETSIVLLAYYLFHRYQASLSGSTVVGRGLKTIGKYTLEIYLLHYFVLPRHLEFVPQTMGLSDNPLWAMFVTLCLALMVIAVVMVAISVLQANAYLRRWIWNK